MSIPQIDHVVAALGRLRSQFASDPSVVALVTIFAARFNTLEQTFQDLSNLRGVYTGQGVQLDNIGQIVGLARKGLDDTHYQLYLFAQIAANNSDGARGDLIKIGHLVVDFGNDPTRIVVTDEGTATVRVNVADIELGDDVGAVLNAMEQQAKAAGVRVVTQWTTIGPSLTFTLDGSASFQSLDHGHLASGMG